MTALREVIRQTIDDSELARKLCGTAGVCIALVGPDTHELFPVGARISANTPVEIGSLTKVFTGLLFAEAIRRGEIELDTPVDRLFFEETWAGAPAITAGQLSTHTSGLPRLSMSTAAIILHRSDPYRGYDRGHLLEYLRREQPRGPETATVNYSNFGYAVLGLMLEYATSKSYEELLRERLLRPLAMDQTTLQLVNALDRPAKGHRGNGEEASLWHMDGYAPCGAIVSTVDDLIKIVRSFLEAESFLAGSLAMTLEPRAAMPGGSIGLAWVLPASGNSYWHNGGTAGYTSYLGVYKPRRMGVVVVANQALPKELTELGHQLLRVVALTKDGQE